MRISIKKDPIGKSKIATLSDLDGLLVTHSYLEAIAKGLKEMAITPNCIVIPVGVSPVVIDVSVASLISSELLFSVLSNITRHYLVEVTGNFKNAQEFHISYKQEKEENIMNEIKVSFTQENNYKVAVISGMKSGLVTLKYTDALRYALRAIAGVEEVCIVCVSPENTRDVLVEIQLTTSLPVASLFASIASITRLYLLQELKDVDKASKLPIILVDASVGDTVSPARMEARGGDKMTRIKISIASEDTYKVAVISGLDSGAIKQQYIDLLNEGALASGVVTKVRSSRVPVGFSDEVVEVEMESTADNCTLLHLLSTLTRMRILAYTTDIGRTFSTAIMLIDKDNVVRQPAPTKSSKQTKVYTCLDDLLTQIKSSSASPDPYGKAAAQTPVNAQTPQVATPLLPENLVIGFESICPAQCLTAMKNLLKEKHENLVHSYISAYSVERSNTASAKSVALSFSNTHHLNALEFGVRMLDKSIAEFEKHRSDCTTCTKHC